MSLWEFQACAEGWRQANSAEEPPPEPPSDDEFLKWIGKR